MQRDKLIASTVMFSTHTEKNNQTAKEPRNRLRKFGLTFRMEE